MANNDFFLNFGSNAAPFASKLSDEIKPATESILGLIDALEDYEGTLAKARGANTPLNNLFGRLDQATAQFGELTGTLSTTFNKAIEGVTLLREDLSLLVTEINKLQSARPAGRRAIATAATTETDVAVGTSRRQQKALADILEGNAITARNALKRVADINNTVSRAAGGAADQLQILGKAIRDLRKDATETRGGLGGGLGGGVNLIFAGGGAENLAAAGGANVQGLLDALTRMVGSSVGQVVGTATDAAADAAAMKVTKGVTPLSTEDLSRPARPGRYALPGQEGSRPVGFDVYSDRGETYEKYFARKERETAAVRQIRETMPQGDPADLKAYNLFRATGGKQSDEIFNRVVNSPTMSMEQVRASYPGLQLGALTPKQINDLPDVLRRVNALKQAQMTHATQGVTQLLQSNPFMSFQGGVLAGHDPEREVGNIVAQAAKEIDERILSGDPHLNFGAAEPGARFRAEARDTGRALKRIDYRSRYTGEYNDATVTELKLRGVTEPLEVRKARQAANASDAKEFFEGEVTPERLRAQAERSPEVAQVQAQIRQLQEQRGTRAGDTEVARLLGLQPTTTRDVVANNQGLEALQARASASGLRSILQTSPDVIITKLAQEQEDFIRRASGIKSHNADVAASRGSLERLSNPATAAAEADRILQERMHTGMAGFEQAQVRHGINVTEDQHGEAISRLEAQREAAIERNIQSLKAQAPVAAPRPVEPEPQGRTTVAELLGMAEPGLIEQYMNTPEDRARIEQLRGPVRRGETPPLNVMYDPQTGNRLIEDGHHRLAAAHLEGMTEIATNVRESNLRGQGQQVDPLAALEAMATRQGIPTGPGASTSRVEELNSTIADLKTQAAALKSQIESRGGFGGVRGKSGLPEGPEKDELRGLVQQFNALKTEISPYNKELHALTAATTEATTAETKRAASGGGRGGQPPRPPTPTTGGGGDDGDGDEPVPGRKRQRQSIVPPADYSGHVANLQDQTQADLETLRAQLELTESTRALTAEQREAILQTGARYREDPAVRQMDASTRARTFAQATGLSGMEGGNAYSRRTFAREGYLAADPRFGRLAGEIDAATAAETKFADIEEEATGRTVAETNAILRLITARERLARVQANPTSSRGQMASAQREVNTAEQQLTSIRNTQDSQEGGLLGRKLFGQRGFIDSQLRHFGQAIENIAGYTLVFAGFEKLRQLVDTGIQADAAFTKLQGQLDATGRATGSLRAQLQGVSSSTAQSLPAVVEAASELTGVFKTNADLVQGTKIAAQLANISQGTLTAKEAAVGLRDVTDAYGISGAQGIQRVGDEITRLSQITGVSVKDVMEGTTQLAQEAKAFHLPQRTAAVLSAYVTRATGETGESAAEQVSRILSQLNVGRVQTALEKTRVPGTNKTLATPEMFASGDIGGVLQNLLANFDKLNNGQKQAITAMIGTGRQARAFAGLLRDASAAAKEMGDSQNDMGALAAQNKRFLDSLAGTIKSLENDFKNLGATLQQLGVFDILGLFAKALDEVLKAFNSTFGQIGQFFNMNPITKGLKDIIVMTGEAGLAFRLLGGSIGSVLGRTIQPGRRVEPVLNARGVPIIDEKTQLPEERFVPYTFSEFGRNVVGAPRGIARRVQRGFGSVADSTAQFFVPQAGASRYGIGREELEGMSGGRARFRAVASARLAQTVEGEASAGLLTRSMNSLSVAASGVAENSLGKFRGAINRIGTSAVASMAGLLALTFVIEKISQALANRSALEKGNQQVLDDLSGTTAAAAKAKNAGQGPEETQAQKDARKANNPGFFDSVVNFGIHSFTGRDTTTFDPNTMDGVDIGFDRVMASTTRLGNKRLQHANSLPQAQRAKALEDAKAANDKDIQQTADFIKSLGLNPQQTANAANDLAGIRDSFNRSFESLHAQADGIAKINQLNLTQIDNLNTALSQAQGMTAETLNQYPQMGQSILDQSGLAVGSDAYNQLAQSLGYTVSPVQGPMAPGQKRGSVLSQNPNLDATSYAARVQGEIAASQNAIQNANEFLATNANPGDPQVQQAIKARDTAAQNLQTYRQQLRQLQQQNPLTREALDEAQGKTKDAVADLQSSNAAFVDANKHLQQDDPQYLANLKAIQDNKVKIAQLQSESAVQAADLAAASTNDPLIKARQTLVSALAKQAGVAAEPGGGSQADRNAAAIGVAQATISKAQSVADLTEAQFQQGIAGRVQNQTTIQSQINDILRQENLAASGTLASQQQLTQLKAQEAQLRQQSTQYAADTYNAGLEEQIAVLQAHGQAGDLEKAARLGVQEAQAKVRQYLAKPGATKGDAEYKQLIGAVATAQRNAFDVALQAQLDTLDFEVATYQISSETEIEALRRILQEKQLTLKERRDIAQKIRSLQTSLSQELTGGGFNIAQDIKLPTAYQIRRSLGLGGSSGTQIVTTTNNNNTVTVNNTVPNTAIAAAVAKQVVAMLSSANSSAARANAPMPPLVGG